MSAAVLVLPVLQAMAAAHDARPGFGRKGPHAYRRVAIPATVRHGHSLRLVQARAAEPVRVVAMPLRVQPELAFYRQYTEAMLRRYLKLSMESGRVPSLLGQEMFRGKVTSCRVTGFDDVVIFVEDMSKCLDRLDAGQRHLLRRVAVEGYTLVEASAMTGIPLRTLTRRYREALDRLTRILLDRKLLKPMGDIAM